MAWTVARRLSILIFQTFGLEENKRWHITTAKKNENGDSGKKPKKRYCVSMALMKERLKKSVLTTDRVDFNSNRRFYRWTNDVAEYLEEMSDTPPQKEVFTVTDLLNEIENKNLYQMLLTVDKRTLKIVLLKMQGYSTKEMAVLIGLTTGAIYARLDHLRKKLKQFQA